MYASGKGGDVTLAKLAQPISPVRVAILTLVDPFAVINAKYEDAEQCLNLISEFLGTVQQNLVNCQRSVLLNKSRSSTVGLHNGKC